MVARPGSPPRRLIARSLDAVARDLLSSSEVWRVHSVFDRAANLRSAGGELLGLALAPAPDAPATVVVGSNPGDGPLSADVAPGMAGFVNDDMLSIGERLTIDLRNAALWSPPPIKRTAAARDIQERIGLAQ